MLRPRSILQLVLTGFGVVTIPLVVAFFITAVSVSELSDIGQQAVLRAAGVVQESRVLAEQAAAMERNGRQYLVLEDPALLELYRQRRSQFRRAAEALHRLELTGIQRSLLKELEDLEGDLYRRLTARDPRAAATEIDPRELAVLTSLARGVLGDSGQLITADIQALSDSAKRVHRLLLWETVALVPAALGLGGIFVFLIIRPLRSLNTTIHRLAAGRFDEKVSVRGPRDLQRLGEQLEWMRLRLQELEDQKTLFLRNISHELKTPLTTLREGTQLLREEVVGPLDHEQREIVDLLYENSVQLQRLIEDLLQFSVAQSASLHIDRKPLALAPLIETALAEHRLPIQAKGLSLETELEPIVVSGDRMKLKAVFGNLISNAIKFSPPDSSIRITLAANAPWAVFDITDSGPGVGGEERQRIFEAFYQGSVSFQGHVQGSGLGLSIAKEFVRLHQGTIHVMESAQGAHFRVCIPLASEADAADPAADEDADSVAESGGGRRLRELDDHTGNGRRIAGTAGEN